MTTQHLGTLASFAAAALIAACGADETGKYQTGPDDPARKVTEKDIAQVDAVLNKQAEADRANGLRQAKAHPPMPAEKSNGTPVAPKAEAQTPAPAAQGGKIAIRELEAPLPEGWKSVPPASSMRSAEFQLAAEPGDPEPGTIGVFYFGADAGGIQPNIDRWIGQFAKADGSPATGSEKIERMKAGAMEVILLDLSGTMAASQMPGAPSTPERPAWRLLGGIVVSPEGPYFFSKGTGPEKTMAAHKERMVKFLTSLAPKGPGGESTAGAAMPAQPAMPPAAAAPASGAGTEITIQSIAATLPAGWKSAPPSSAMRLAEIKIPASAGDAAEGLITVFYFGPDAGTIEMNLDRWYAQFSRADGKNPRDAAIRESLRTATGLEITLVDVSGTMAPSNMPGAPATPERTNWRLLGAIVASPEGPYFFKGTGPEKTMGENKDAMVAFLKSARVK